MRPTETELMTPLPKGQKVRLKGYNPVIGTVVEFRGTLGLKDRFVYRIALPSKPIRSYIELPDDQFEVISTLKKTMKYLKKRPRVVRPSCAR